MKNIDLINEEAVQKLRELAWRAKIGYFQTGLKSVPLHGRPMLVAQIDEQGALWFFSMETSHKNHDITTNNKVVIIFSRPHASEFLDVFGEATIVTDRVKMREIWTSALISWFPRGLATEGITLIKVKPIEAHYWDTTHSAAVMLFKGVLNALTGVTMNGDVEGGLIVEQ